MKLTFTKIAVILLAILTVVSIMAIQSLKEERAKRIIADQNIAALTSEIEQKVTENGEAYAKIQGLQLSLSDFKSLYEKTVRNLRDMEIKLKNAQGIIIEVPKIQYVNKDSIIYVPMITGQKNFTINEQYLKAEVVITNDSLIKPGDFKIKDIPDTLTLVPTFKYKGWWFWKKSVGVELFIKHSNPFITTQSAEYISIKN